MKKENGGPKADHTCPKCKRILHTRIGPFQTHVRWCGAAPTYTPDIFWEKVDKSAGPDACWPYTGYITPDGYGWAYTGSMTGQRTHGAHRQAWILTHGPIAKGRVICHHCDNRRCCNPKHLFIGTPGDNHLDMRQKDRHQKKINTAQAREALSLKGKATAEEVAARFNVSPKLIEYLWVGRTWRHLRPPAERARLDALYRRVKPERPPRPKGQRPRANRVVNSTRVNVPD